MLPDDDDVHAGDVDSQTPPVHEARDVDAGEENTPGHTVSRLLEGVRKLH